MDCASRGFPGITPRHALPSVLSATNRRSTAWTPLSVLIRKKPSELSAYFFSNVSMAPKDPFELGDSRISASVIRMLTSG